MKSRALGSHVLSGHSWAAVGSCEGLLQRAWCFLEFRPTGALLEIPWELLKEKEKGACSFVLIRNYFSRAHKALLLPRKVTSAD